jgi:hypothetical protein
VGILLSLLAMTCLASGATLALGALLEGRHAIQLWRSKTIAARDVATATGIFDVRGSVVARAPLQGPLTGRPCVQFVVVMERKQPKRGQKRDGEPDLLTWIESSPFTLDDGTGKLHINLADQRVPVTGTSIIKQPLERLTAPLERMLHARLKKPGGLWCSGRDVVATEAALENGAEASVVAKKSPAGDLVAVHVTTGRPRVVAMQGLTRSGMAASGALILGALWMWLR